MRRAIVAATTLVLGLTAALLVTGRSTAGPDRIAFPAGWKDHVLYVTVDRHDVKQHRELCASTQEAVQAMREGRRLPHGTLLTLVQYKACFRCHEPHEGQDFVISLASLKGCGAAAGGQDDVAIANFAFGPGKLTAAPDKPLTWVNRDDSPHQITATAGAQSRGPVLTRGQSYSCAFAEAGSYDDICGLHPNRKGQVEVR